MQPLLAPDSSALPDLLPLIADGRASPVHQFKLAQGISPSRQFAPRQDGQRPDYSASANREAIVWFASHPSPPTPPLAPALFSIHGGVKEGYRCIDGSNPSTLPSCSPDVYRVSAYAASAPFTARMSAGLHTPQWVTDVADGLPAIHTLWT